MTNNKWEDVVDYFFKFQATNRYPDDKRKLIEKLSPVIQQLLQDRDKEIVEKIMNHKFNTYEAYKALSVGKEVISKSTPEIVLDYKELVNVLRGILETK